MNNWRKTHPTCVCPSGEGFHFTIRPPDAADCAQAKEQPSTQNLILQGGSITVSLPWLSCWGPIVQYINFINMHLLNIMPIFFTREIYHTAWTYIFFKKETKPSRSPFHQWTRWPLWCVHHCCEGSGHRWDSPEQLCSGVSSRQVNDPPNERSNKTPRDEHMPYIYIYMYIEVICLCMKDTLDVTHMSLSPKTSTEHTAFQHLLLISPAPAPPFFCSHGSIAM